MSDTDSAKPNAEHPLPPTTPGSNREADGRASRARREIAKRADRLTASTRRWWRWGAGAVLLFLIFIEGVPWLVTALTTASTDDAFVNGHVTLVAPWVPGHIAQVLVDDNNRVHTGDTLVELSMPGSVEEIGRSLVLLSLVFGCSALIRRWSSPLRKLFIPTAVIGGFLVLGLGPEGMGRLLGGTGLFPENVFAVWRQLPAQLVTLMSASLLLGEHLPPLRKIWSISGSHVIMISVMSMGQFAVGGILVWLLLNPIFGIDRKAGALLEMSFNGGHGTLAGLTPVLQHYGVEDLVAVGLGLATIGILSGIVIGTTLVNYAIRSPSISVVRQNPVSADEDFAIDYHLPRPDDQPMDEWKGMPQVTAAAVFLGVTIALAIALLALFRVLFHQMGSSFFDRFPLFPFTFPAAVIVQLCARQFDF